MKHSNSEMSAKSKGLMQPPMDLHIFTFPLMGMENGGLAIAFYTAISQLQYTLADAHHVHCDFSS